MNSANKVPLTRSTNLVRSSYYTFFVRCITLFLPLSVVAILYLFVIDPQTADELATEDGVVENLSALFLFLATATALFASSWSFIKKNTPLGMVLLFAAICLFVIGMEEISWGQRVIGFETNEVFQQYNQQGEMNLHNLDTLSSETIYYLGAFLLLVLAPFYNKALTGFFAARKWLRNLQPLIPSLWLLVPFSLIMGFVKGAGNYVNPLYSIALLVTVFILTFTVFTAVKVRTYAAAVLPAISLVLLVVSFALFTFYDYGALGIRTHMATEYKEFFIALGLLTYTLVVARKTVLFDRHALR